MEKRISILGATGSVGLQALSVAEERGYCLDLLTANRSASQMEQIARKHKPMAVAMADPKAAGELRTRLADTSIKVYSGTEGIKAGISEYASDTVINAILGADGLPHTLHTIESGITLALANKESLVIAGELVMSKAKAKGVGILPVDSEHSAIFQALKCGRKNEVKRLLLTASGGPFFGKTRAELERVTLDEALAHPTWSMGKKITIDSSTLMNKGFEIIEAAHLFGITDDRIEVLIHRESILHSAVEFVDNSVIGQMSVPDMRMCIQYAVDYPDRVCAAIDPLDLTKVGSLTFAKPDTVAFPLLDLARQAIRDGGASGAVLNASDEVAVSAFLEGKIAFSDISRVVCEAYEQLSDSCYETTLDGILSYDRLARRAAEDIVRSINK